MTTIAGHTLFPHAADWSVAPAWRRRWQTGISAGVSGREQRQALRARPRHTLEVSVRTRSLAERARLDARMDQALTSGYGCLPFFGFGSGLAAAAAAGAGAVTLADAAAPWAWAAGDYLALVADDDTAYDCWLVTAAAGNDLALAGNLANTWPAGAVARPLLFGKFTARKNDQITDWHSSVRIAIEQLVAERTAQLGAVTPAAGIGVGSDQVAVDNDIL